MSKSSYFFDFELSETEFTEAHRNHLRGSLLTGKNLILISLALGLAALQAQVLGPNSSVSVIFLGLWVAIIAFTAFAYLWLPIRFYRKNRGYQESQKITFTSDHVEWKRLDRVDETPWTEVLRTRESPAFYYFYSKGGLPMILPKKVFSSEVERADFRDYVADKLATSH